MLDTRIPTGVGDGRSRGPRQGRPPRPVAAGFPPGRPPSSSTSRPPPRTGSATSASTPPPQRQRGPRRLQPQRRARRRPAEPRDGRARRQRIRHPAHRGHVRHTSSPTSRGTTAPAAGPRSSPSPPCGSWTCATARAASPPAALQPGRWVDLRVTGRAGIPADATAVVLNVTGTQVSGGTHVRVYPTPGARESQVPPEISNLNLAPGRDQPNAVTVRVGDGGRVRFYNHSAAAYLIADVAGYYTATGDHGFVPLTPTRIARHPQPARADRRHAARRCRLDPHRRRSRRRALDGRGGGPQRDRRQPARRHPRPRVPDDRAGHAARGLDDQPGARPRRGQPRGRAPRRTPDGCRSTPRAPTSTSWWTWPATSAGRSSPHGSVRVCSLPGPVLRSARV